MVDKTKTIESSAKIKQFYKRSFSNSNYLQVISEATYFE